MRISKMKKLEPFYGGQEKCVDTAFEETLLLFLFLATTFLKNTSHIAPIH